MKDKEDFYQTKIVPEMTKQFGYKNPMEVPKLEKVTLNMGLGEAVNDKKIVDIAFEEMKLIAGQAPLKTFTKKSIAGFKIRDGWPIGVKVTLRRKRMHDFVFKLVNMVLPFIRDFRGLNAKAFDGRGNYNFGIKEHLVFPEIDFNTIEKMFGLNVTVTTTAKSDEEALMLLKLYGFPLR
ncbi:MAG: 50S ribosomal protein L5 [Legionellales bacterium]|nr:50S ribosomal protein L5 [Legionellales bacterium]|tara:strand:- start:19344 stop:19880 length:537 start_codon:yes stop_codon:yes gene_type:complete